MEDSLAAADFSVRIPSPLIELNDPRLESSGVRVLLKRDDLIHPGLPGNKWRKLKYNLEAARRQGHQTILTFGGAYSNHLRATAAAGQYFGFHTVGVVRGEEHAPLNESLAYAVDHGMRLTYLDRATYRRKSEEDVLDRLIGQFGRCYILPEGGSNDLAVHGCAEMMDEIDVPFSVICCACGTGCTLAGISTKLQSGQRAIGFSVLKGGGFLEGEVRRFHAEAGYVGNPNFSVDTRFHFGGYAKRTANLDAFIAEFETRHGITLDWVYEAKMMHGLFERIAAGDFPAPTTIIAVLC
ncbi:pyridoxal-phosphate dependent enzyme [Amycolatopsis sp. NPDC004079]|uniref:1-aminocyclopropane-1-carboxylate deaminase/D-cysteine desulfhydrase n=1 Tax=Amycolatopsis sp. NPDC004079 TaxID=3154549 RepID=UPI0033AAEA32